MKTRKSWEIGLLSLSKNLPDQAICMFLIAPPQILTNQAIKNCLKILLRELRDIVGILLILVIIKNLSLLVDLWLREIWIALSQNACKLNNSCNAMCKSYLELLWVYYVTKLLGNSLLCSLYCSRFKNQNQDNRMSKETPPSLTDSRESSRILARNDKGLYLAQHCLLYTSPSPRDS